MKALILLFYVFNVFVSTEYQWNIHQSNIELKVSGDGRSESNIESYFPSPHINVGFEDEIFQALELKFNSTSTSSSSELLSNIEYTILDNDKPQYFKAMYYVWVTFRSPKNNQEDGLAIVAVGINPEVLEYFTEKTIRQSFKEQEGRYNFPENILSKIKVILAV